MLELIFIIGIEIRTRSKSSHASIPTKDTSAIDKLVIENINI